MLDGNILLFADKMKCLRLYYCFKKAGDDSMCKSIEDAAKLDEQQIDLSMTRLSPSDLECVTLFLTCASHKEWKKVSFHSCYIQDHGLKVLQRGLRSSNVTIASLGLSWNYMTVISSPAISDLAISCRVKTLAIVGNPTIGEDDRLYKMITDDSSLLEVLYMYMTNLSSSAAVKLFSALSEAKKLKLLGISNNQITDEACDAIIMAMKKNTSLVTLYLNKNLISGESALRIVQTLQHNNTLHELSLNSDYPDHVMKKIISLQEVNRNREAQGCRIKLV